MDPETPSAPAAAPPRSRWLAAAGLAALTASIFPPLVSARGVLYERDIHLYWAAHAAALVRIVASGALPLWNPQAGLGEPMLANPAIQVLYPLTALHLVLAPWWVYSVLVLSHTLLSAIGAHALARSLGRSHPASLLAGGAWIASGPFLSLVGLTQHFTAAAWLPWVALAARRALAPGGSRLALVAWAAGGALQILAGSADLTLMTAAAAMVAAAADRGWPDREALTRVARRTAAAAMLTLAFSAAQWMPTLEQLVRSERSNLSLFVRTYWSMHPASLLEVALPLGLDELPLQTDVRGALFEGREPFLKSVYLGIAALPLAAAGLLAGRRRASAALGTLALLAMLLALGRHSPVYGLAATIIPVLRIVRYPVKAMLLAAFAVSQLAALGLDTWRDAERSRHARVVAAVTAALLLAAAGAGWWLVAHDPAGWGPGLVVSPTHLKPTDVGVAVASRLAWAGGAALLVALAAAVAGGSRLPLRAGAHAAAVVAVLDLVLVNHRLNPTAPVEFFTWIPPTVAAARPRGLGRLHVFDYRRVHGASQRFLGRADAYTRVVPGGTVEPAWVSLRSARVYPMTPVNLAWNIASSYEADPIGLYPPERTALVRALRVAGDRPLRDRLLRMGAVDTVVALHAEGFEDLEPAAVVPSMYPEPMRVFRVPRSRPRAWVVGVARVVAPEAALAAISADGFDPAHHAIVEQGPPLDGGGAFVGTARIHSLVGDRVALDVEASGDAILVLADAFDTGWRATIDGKPTDVLRVNAGFRGLRVPAGRHEVEMRYRPPSVVLGVATTVLTVVLALWAIRRARSDKTQT